MGAAAGAGAGESPAGVGAAAGAGAGGVDDEAALEAPELVAHRSSPDDEVPEPVVLPACACACATVTFGTTVPGGSAARVTTPRTSMCLIQRRGPQMVDNAGNIVE